MRIQARWARTQSKQNTDLNEPKKGADVAVFVHVERVRIVFACETQVLQTPEGHIDLQYQTQKYNTSRTKQHNTKTLFFCSQTHVCQSAVVDGVHGVEQHELLVAERSVAEGAERQVEFGELNPLQQKDEERSFVHRMRQ